MNLSKKSAKTGPEGPYKISPNQLPIFTYEDVKKMREKDYEKLVAGMEGSPLEAAPGYCRGVKLQDVPGGTPKRGNCLNSLPQMPVTEKQITITKSQHYGKVS